MRNIMVRSSIKPAHTVIVDRSGATVVEYGLIAGLLAIMVVAAVSLLDAPVRTAYSGIGDRFENLEVDTANPAGD